MDYQSLLKLSYKDQAEYKNTYGARFNNECATVIDFDIGENKAFYLNNQEILLLITKIMAVDKELSEKAKQLPDIALERFTKQALVDEIKQTNDIENVYSTRKEIKETFKRIERGEEKGRFNGLVGKYYKFQKGEQISLESCEDIRKLYDEIVLPEVVEEDKDNAPDGLIFRKEPVNIHTSTGKIIHSGMYPEGKIINAMTNALKILNDGSINYLIAAAVFHYLFAYIHPFYDGNGRCDRFISSYVISQNLNHLVAYRFSYIIKKHQPQYYKMFSDTNDMRNKGDLTPFIIQFLEFILEVEKELVEDTENKILDLNFYSKKLENFNLSKTAKHIANVLLQNSLFDDEGLSVKQICDIEHKAYNTVAKELLSLDEFHIIKHMQVGNKKVFDIDLNRLIRE
ncbi:MAG: Fic family protein [Eubacterium sp.]|nr:Fic family protein [Eubacterium sp.]